VDRRALPMIWALLVVAFAFGVAVGVAAAALVLEN
jgi:hypothetical protein